MSTYRISGIPYPVIAPADCDINVVDMWGEFVALRVPFDHRIDDYPSAVDLTTGDVKALVASGEAICIPSRRQIVLRRA